MLLFYKIAVCESEVNYSETWFNFLLNSVNEPAFLTSWGNLFHKSAPL